MRHCPNAEEIEPSKHVRRAIDDITALLGGEKKSLRAIQLDMSRVQPFNARVYETTRAIPPGVTRTYGADDGAIEEADETARRAHRVPVEVLAQEAAKDPNKKVFLAERTTAIEEILKVIGD